MKVNLPRARREELVPQDRQRGRHRSRTAIDLLLHSFWLLQLRCGCVNVCSGVLRVEVKSPPA